MSNLPLKGITVLDLSRLLPGPMCTLHLADLGADVIKIEDPQGGDYARVVPPLQKTTSRFFLMVNRNKRSVTLDLRKEEGRDVFLKLVKMADVIVESFRPGVVARLGIDYETIRQVNPGIIYCSITGFGQTGPLKDKAGHDLNFVGYSGIIKKLPGGNNKPSILNFQLGDIVGGSLNAALGILAAIIQQKETGEGQYLDVSILDGLVSHAVVNAANANSGAMGLDTSDMLNGALHCYNLYRTNDDRFMVLAALEYKFWERFCKAIKRPDLTASHMVAGTGSKEMLDELDLIFSKKTQKEWIAYFKDEDCCVSPVLTTLEAMGHDQVQSRGMASETTHPIEGKCTQLGMPFKSSAYDLEVRHFGPELGQHTDEILLAAGYDQDMIKGLRDNGIV